MHYVYLLQSSKSNRLYIGRTSNLRERFKRHNFGKVQSTKAYKPWTLVYYEAYRGKPDSTKREIWLKKHAAKQELKNRLKYSLQ